MDKIGKLKYDIINNNYLYYCTFFSDEKQNGCNSLLSIKEAVSYVLLNLPNFSIVSHKFKHIYRKRNFGFFGDYYHKFQLNKAATV